MAFLVDSFYCMYILIFSIMSLYDFCKNRRMIKQNVDHALNGHVVKA